MGLTARAAQEREGLAPRRLPGGSVPDRRLGVGGGGRLTREAVGWTLGVLIVLCVVLTLAAAALLAWRRDRARRRGTGAIRIDILHAPEE